MQRVPIRNTSTHIQNQSLISNIYGLKLPLSGPAGSNKHLSKESSILTSRNRSLQERQSSSHLKKVGTEYENFDSTTLPRDSKSIQQQIRSEKLKRIYTIEEIIEEQPSRKSVHRSIAKIVKTINRAKKADSLRSFRQKLRTLEDKISDES